LTPLVRAILAERVRLRKSWALLAAILAPLCQVGFLGVVFALSAERVRPFRPGFRFWLELNCMTWNLVLMPISVALLCALSWEQERDAKALNHILAQPLPRHCHFLAKLAGHLGLALGSQGLLWAALPLAGWLLRYNPDLLMGPFPAGLWLQFTAYSALACLAVTALQTWFAMRVPALWAGLAVAAAGSWLALRWLEGPLLIQLLPWDLAGHAVVVFDRRQGLPWHHAWGSLAAALLVSVLGAADFRRRGGYRA
jgi:hypothetical protein